MVDSIVAVVPMTIGLMVNAIFAYMYQEFQLRPQLLKHHREGEVASHQQEESLLRMENQ